MALSKAQAGVSMPNGNGLVQHFFKGHDGFSLSTVALVYAHNGAALLSERQFCRLVLPDSQNLGITGINGAFRDTGKIRIRRGNSGEPVGLHQCPMIRISW